MQKSPVLYLELEAGERDSAGVTLRAPYMQGRASALYEQLPWLPHCFSMDDGEDTGLVPFFEGTPETTSWPVVHGPGEGLHPTPWSCHERHREMREPLTG